MSDKPTLISFAEFREFIFDDIVPIEDIIDSNEEPISNMLPFWRKNDLVPFIPKGKHIKLSFAGLIWLRILDTLRQFSYPIAITRKICDYFFKDAYDDGLPERNMKHNQKQFLTKKQAGTLTDQETLALEYLEQFLADKPLLYMLKFDINYLTTLVTECITDGEERGILIFPDGRVGETNGLEIRTHGKYKIDRAEPHIYLSIPYFLKEFIESDQLSTLFMPQILNDDEKKVLREMKNRNVREINISLKDGEILKIKSTKGRTVSGAEAREVMKILGLKNYQSITIDTLDDSRLSFKHTVKKI
jgi:hypothetical protein